MRAGSYRSRKATRTGKGRVFWRAWLASLTVAVFAIAPLLAIFHRVSVRHAVCEHGELVESDHPGFSIAEKRERRGADALREDPSPTLRADSESESHGHRHCSVGTLARKGVSKLACTDVIAMLAPVAAWQPLHREFAVAGAILSNAPKTSPPAPIARVSA
jgi:hypothetical protein